MPMRFGPDETGRERCRMTRQANMKRTRDNRMLQRSLGTVLLAFGDRFKRVKGYVKIAQVIATIEVECSEPHSVPI